MLKGYFQPFIVLKGNVHRQKVKTLRGGKTKFFRFFFFTGAELLSGSGGGSVRHLDAGRVVLK